MSSSVISAKGESAPWPCVSAFLRMSSKSFASSPPAFLTRSRTRPRELRSSNTIDEDHAVPDERHVEVVALALVEMDRELFFAEDLGEAAGRRDAAGRQAREARAVDAPQLARLADQLPGLVDDEDALRVGVSDEPLDDPEDAVEVLLLHHELGLNHRHLPL